MSEFEIDYRDGKQIVTHPSGLVVEYTKHQMEKLAATYQSRLVELNASIQTCESSISEIVRSTEITG